MESDAVAGITDLPAVAAPRTDQQSDIDRIIAEHQAQKDRS